jgi:hypothetical protein
MRNLTCIQVQLVLFSTSPPTHVIPLPYLKVSVMFDDSLSVVFISSVSLQCLGWVVVLRALIAPHGSHRHSHVGPRQRITSSIAKGRAGRRKRQGSCPSPRNQQPSNKATRATMCTRRQARLAASSVSLQSIVTFPVILARHFNFTNLDNRT